MQSVVDRNVVMRRIYIYTYKQAEERHYIGNQVILQCVKCGTQRGTRVTVISTCFTIAHNRQEFLPGSIQLCAHSKYGNSDMHQLD